MVKIEINDKASSYANVLIPEGYFPGQVKSVELFKKDDKIVVKTLKDGTLARSLIVKFKVFKADENGKPTSPFMSTYKIEGGASISEEVILSSFIYYEYEKNGVKNSALTVKSNAGKLFAALGYDFASKIPLDTDKFVGKWAKLNIADYEKEVDGKTVIKSVIKDVSKYKGPAIEEVKSSPKAEDMTEDEIETIDGDDDLL